MPQQFTHFVPDEQPQQFTHFVPDEGAAHTPPPPEEKPGIVSSYFHGLVDPILHPANTASQQGEGFTASGMAPGGMYPTTAATGRKEDSEANKQLQMSAQKNQGEAAKSMAANPGNTAAGMAGNLTLALLTGGLLKGAEGLPYVGRNLSERFGGYESPVIPQNMQAASRMAEAIRPQGGIMPDFESSLATNTPKMKAFAQETGNPLHSQWETGEAFRGLANKGLEHFKTNFIQPFEREQISMRTVPEYQGPVMGEGRMTTIGQLEKRISDINDMQRAAQRTAKTTGAQMSAEQALGLENEASKLRGILYNEIGKRTGTDPNLIRDLRQSYGQQFNIADTIDAARRARLGQTGASAEMGGSVPFSKTGLLEKAMQGIRGGQEYIANARLRKALQAFQPENVEYPRPNGSVGNRGVRQ